MSLLELQTSFRAEIVGGDEDPEPSSLGMTIYRDAYRGRLLAALETGFERTRRWVGADAFTAAACHYVLANPPRDWTLDNYGAGFPALLEALFVGDPEVAELAWLEWQMQSAFAAPDAPELDPATFAAAYGSGTDWDRLGFVMAAGFAHRPIATDSPSLWSALASDADFAVSRQEAFILIWRSGLSPHFRVCDEAEYESLVLLAEGGTLADIVRLASGDRLALWLTQWLREGIFSSAVPR